MTHEKTHLTDKIGTKTEPKYRYSFYTWPDEQRGYPKALFDLSRMLKSRIEMEFTAIEFVRFRLDVEGAGTTLREITRSPAQEEETVL